MELIDLNAETADNISAINRLAGGEFLQTWAWGKLVAAEGEIIERWGATENNQVRAVMTVIKKHLFGPFFYWYAPRGPIGEKIAIEFLLTEFKKKKTGAIFLRLEPQELPTGLGLNHIKKSVALQPQKTLILDLSRSVEELLKAMHPKTRYNIKLAEKKGVEIVSGTAADFSEFWRLLTLTGERDGFRLHGAAHYQNLLNAPEFIKLYFARHEGKNIATGLFSFWGERVTYLHGASDNEARNLMAPYLLQWEIIKEAQKEAYKYYDFYGIDEVKWPGVTRFKLGFGGETREYAGTYDYILRPGIYNLYELGRKLRRMIK
ncbi:MAG: peptidoglycan bridge formation glycyltransferase FemA/FemB family protein [Patescibacteria group bacterium]